MPPFLKSVARGVLLQIHAVPNARKTEITGIHGDALKIKIQAPPVDGKANTEIQNFLSDLLQVPKSQVQITRGEKSRSKEFLISGLDIQSVENKLSS